MPERIVRPGILSSDAVCSLSWQSEVFYRRLMSVVDDYGRYDGRLPILRAALYPLQLEKVSDSDVGKWRLETAKAGLVRIYAVEGKEFIEISKFDQRIQGKPKWPSPSDVPQGTVVSPGSTVTHGDSRESTALFGDGDVGVDEKNSGKGKSKFDPSLVPLPDCIPPESWAAWCKHRREIGHRLTESQVDGQIKKLVRFHANGHDPARVIQDSIDGGYQGLFEPRVTVKHGGSQNVDTEQAWQSFRGAIRDGRTPTDPVIAMVARGLGGIQRLGEMNSFDIEKKRAEFDRLYRENLRAAA